MTITIDHDTPLPEDGQHRAVYPWADMQVGSSFALPRAKYATLKAAAYLRGKRHGERYTVRVRGDEARVWRVA